MTAISTLRLPVLMNAWLNALNPFAANADQHASQPETTALFPVKIHETESAITFEAQLTDLNSVDTQVYIHRGELTLEITRHDGDDVSHITRYSRDFQLPASVRDASAAISLHGNMLCVKLPKKIKSR